MIRFAVIVSLLVIVGCADQSKGTALDECRMQQYLESAAAQDELIPECMKAKSFQMTSQCSPGSDGPEWNQRVLAYTNEMILWEEYRAVHSDGYAYSRYCQLF